MRIVGGALSGRRFVAPPGARTRPTSERARESIASALDARGWIEGRSVLDLFAGTGALAFEALSRGAARAVLIDVDRVAIKTVEQNARELGLGDRVRAMALDLYADRLVRALGDARFDLVFLDPPYAEIAMAHALLTALLDAGKLGEGAAIVIEHAKREPPVLPRGLELVSSYRHGDTAVLLAQRSEERR